MKLATGLLAVYFTMFFFPSVTFRRELFCGFRECSNVTATLGDDGQCLARGVGTILIRKFVNGRWENGRIKNMLYVPKLKKNLFSVGVCTDLGYEFNFKRNEVYVSGKDGIVAKGIK